MKVFLYMMVFYAISSLFYTAHMAGQPGVKKGMKEAVEIMAKGWR